jgi:hypothetical protein
MELIEPSATEESRLHTQHRSSDLTGGRKKKIVPVARKDSSSAVKGMP